MRSTRKGKQPMTRISCFFSEGERRVGDFVTSGTAQRSLPARQRPEKWGGSLRKKGSSSGEIQKAKENTKKVVSEREVGLFRQRKNQLASSPRGQGNIARTWGRSTEEPL